MTLGHNKLLVQLSCANARSQITGGPFIQTPISGIDLSKGAGPPTEVLCLMNMITEETLRDDEEYEGKISFILEL